MNFVAKSFEELTKEELYEILKARCEIFIVERGMRCQDMDGMDQVSRHFLLEEEGKILAYLRAFYDEAEGAVKIGRVLTITHGIGLGAKLMSGAIEDIKKNMKSSKIYVDAQKHAIGFYEKMGFKTVSGEFLEEGVVHVKMELY
ncbi:MAG: GNAT family N-acetyltransferase [Clostridia bacterium]|nr:GNAT family N-acetyltransferase [Clostridia bacterium]